MASGKQVRREIRTKHGMIRIVNVENMAFLGIWCKLEGGIPLTKNEVDAVIRALRKVRKVL